METLQTLASIYGETFQAFEPIDLGAASGGRVTQTAEAIQTNGADGRYREVQVLGRGGLGEVVEAFDQELRRSVALKRPREDRMSARQVSALVEEAQITAQLDHPSIPSVHGLGVDAQQRPYFSMALVTGQTLEQILRQRQTDPEVRAQFGMSRLFHIFTQVGYAVAFAHARGVIHRDIKPDNIMIGQFGEVRLMDWGVAKVVGRTQERAGEALAMETIAPVEVSADRPETKFGTFLGTPGFAAPEQVEGRTDLDERADIYALGVVLYVMLTGRLPVEGKSVLEWLFHTVEGKVVPLKHVVPASKALSAIVHKALARDREGRYETVLEMLADLEAMQQGQPVSALNEAACQRMGRWYMSRPPGLARMRAIDFDLIMWSSFCFGVAALCGVVFWIELPVLWIGVAALVMAVGAGVWPMYTWLRQPKPDDPWHLLPQLGITTTQSSRRSASTGPMAFDETWASPRR